MKELKTELSQCLENFKSNENAFKMLPGKDNNEYLLSYAGQCIKSLSFTQ